MSLFSLEFFKSQRKKDLEELQIKEQKLKNKLLKKELKNNLNTIPVSPTDNYCSDEEENLLIHELFSSKPYLNVKLVNDILTIVFNDGSVIVKPAATQEDFINVRKATSEEEILIITSGKEVVEERKREKKEYDKALALKDGISKLAQYKDFEIKGDSVYLKGIDRSVPQLLVERFLEIIGQNWLFLQEEEEYIALKKFWLKCCLNPNAQSAEDLYTFLSHHQFKIDRHGNFYAYRRVQSRANQHKKLVDFVSNSYNKVKAIWKKPAQGYEVFNDDGYVLVESGKQNHGYNNHVGNLKDLYLDLPNYQENSYTSQHTGEEDYRVGSVISMPRNSGDDNNQISCSKGFHQASKEYDYSGFGDTPILSIINPIDVLAVPLNEVGKLRVCRWFFAMTLSEEEQHILDDDDFDVSELGDVFEEQCSENIEEYVQNSFAEEVKRHTFTIPEMSHLQINRIVKSLSEMKEEISGRVKNVK